MPDTDKLKTFYITAKCGNTREAARELGITQPALTYRIGMLQKEMNVRLFAEGKRPLLLTDEGKKLWEYLERNIGVFRQLEKWNDPGVVKTEGHISLGFRKLLPLSILSGILKDFTALYPDIKIDLLDLAGKEIPGAFSSGKIDIVLTIESQGRNLFDPVTKPVADRWGVLAPASDLTERPYVTTADLNGKPVILPEDEIMAEEILTAFREKGCSPSAVKHSSGSESALWMAESGMGYAFMPLGSNIGIGGTGLLLAPFTPKIPIPCILAVPREGNRSAALKLFISYVSANFR